MLRIKHLIIIGFAGVGLLATTLSAFAVSKEEIMTLTRLNIPDEQIIAAIDRDRTVFNLSVAEILELKKANVSEAVIQYMLKTPKKFGDPSATTVDPGAETPAETAEQRQAREERMREEAAKLLEEQRQADEAQRKAFAQGVLARCRALGDEGDYVGAVRAAQQFMDQGNFTPESEEAYFAKFCTANALVKAGLLQSAASQLVEIVLDGPDRPFFQVAFRQLRQLRQEIDYAPPQLDRLAQYAEKVGTLSKQFQDEFNYVMGEFFHEGAEWATAEAFLNAVSPDSDDYGRAQYLLGFMQVQGDLYRSAVESFQRAIVATEENQSASEVRDLGYLALARIAYRIGDYDAAIYYYRKVPEGSYKQAQSFYESAWVYFLKGDYSRALGTFHALSSPYFRHYFYPEMWILEATTYMNLCHFDRTQLALQRFEEEVMPLITPLEAFLRKTTRPEDYYAAVIALANGDKRYELPAQLLAPILANVEFYNLYRTIKQIESEQRRLQASGAGMGELGTELLDRLQRLRQERILETGHRIRIVLDDTLKELQKFRTKFIEIGIDLEDLKAGWIEDRARAQERGEEVETEIGDAAAGGAVSIVGSDRWRWPFEGEYWRDEVGSYRSTIRDQCVKEDAGGAGMP